GTPRSASLPLPALGIEAYPEPPTLRPAARAGHLVVAVAVTLGAFVGIEGCEDAAGGKCYRRQRIVLDGHSRGANQDVPALFRARHHVRVEGTAGGEFGFESLHALHVARSLSGYRAPQLLSLGTQLIPLPPQPLDLLRVAGAESPVGGGHLPLVAGDSLTQADRVLSQFVSIEFLDVLLGEPLAEGALGFRPVQLIEQGGQGVEGFGDEACRVSGASVLRLEDVGHRFTKLRLHHPADVVLLVVAANDAQLSKVAVRVQLPQ